MTSVRKLDQDTYEAYDFLSSLPHIAITVRFSGDTPYVVARSGCTSKDWDTQAIASVQFAIITNQVRDKN
jgi:hypothetical protein